MWPSSEQDVPTLPMSRVPATIREACSDGAELGGSSSGYTESPAPVSSLVYQVKAPRVFCSAQELY